MPARENFLSDKVQSLLSQFARANGPLRPPIDPRSLAEMCGVLSIEHRSMIPEGVLTPVQKGFRIYLHDNFASLRGVSLRLRFTLAHELVHTFYYDLNNSKPKPAKGSPRGLALERLCHIGAGQILVPETLLRSEIRTNGEIGSVQSILQLAGVFNVSAEVLIRRLHETEGTTDYNFAAILVHAVDGRNRSIRAACYSAPLLCNTAPPRTGLDFDAWVRPLLPTSGTPDTSEWTHTTRSAGITAKKISHSSRTFILELRFS